MEVKLRNHWFGPDGKLYSHFRNPHQFPESFRKSLPKSAEIIGEKEEKKEEKK